MANGSANGSPTRGSHTICVPAVEAEYDAVVQDPGRFRAWLVGAARRSPELFPEGFAEGFRMKDAYVSRKLGVRLRRVELRDGRSYAVRPSFVTPYPTARVADVEDGLFLRRFGAPYRALTGPWPTSWGMTPCSGSGWSVAWAAAASSARPSAGAGSPHTCWPTSTTRPGTARRSTRPRPWAAAAARASA
jgi:hypothetical protein